MRRAAPLLVLLGACDPAGKQAAPGAGRPPKEVAVARIDGQVITAGEVEEHIARLPPYARARYASPEQRKRLLENMVRFELLAREARARGYDRDPEVQRVLKERLVDEWLKKEIEPTLRPEDVSPGEIEAYYRDHLDRFTQAEQIRVSQIQTRSQDTAVRATEEARAAARRGDADAFRRLVEKYSEDEDSRGREGDLAFFDRTTRDVPRPVVEAAFALREIGDVSPPIESERGFHVLKFTQRRAGFVRPMSDVRRDIQKLILQERKAKRIEGLVAEMRGKARIEIYESELRKVEVPRAP